MRYRQPFLNKRLAVITLLCLAPAIMSGGGAADAATNATTASKSSSERRARDFGIAPGVLAPGPLNAITDVEGVLVGHITLIEGDSIRTGATAILPHGGNLYMDRVPAGLHIANGHGKLAGTPQLVELGEIETPIVLTNTLAVSRGMEAVIGWTLKQAGNEKVRSVNAIVGETNDSRLNDIRGRALTPLQILQAIEGARSGPVEEGTIGAGTGTVAFGWKGGIGTSSRRLPRQLGGYTVGVLVQTNFGGILTIDGKPVGRMLDQYYLRDELNSGDADGSIMIVVATDAPLSDRNLTRLARRASVGLARTGSSFSNGSGDFVISFSTAEGVRRTAARRAVVASYAELSNDAVSPLFQAVAEATEEAIYNSLFMSESVSSIDVLREEPVTVEKLPLKKLRYE